MKKFLVAFVLIAGLVAVAYASFSSGKKKPDLQKKEMKKSCAHKCMFG